MVLVSLNCLDIKIKKTGSIEWAINKLMKGVFMSTENAPVS